MAKVEPDPLPNDCLGCRRGGVEWLREPAVEPADAGERLVGPVAPRVAGGKPEAVGQEHGMPGHGLRGVEVFGHERRRHDERLARVRKAFARAAVGWKLFRGIERVDAGEIADRVGVFGVVEPAEHDAAGIARSGAGLGLEEVVEPLPDLGPLLIGWLVGLRRGHLPARDHLGHPLPDLHFAADRIEGADARKVDLPFDQITGMAVLAVSLDQWHHPAVPGRQSVARRRLRPKQRPSHNARHDRGEGDPQRLNSRSIHGACHRLARYVDCRQR